MACVIRCKTLTKTLSSFLLLFSACLSCASASWVPEVDKKYRELDKDSYVKTVKARELLNKWHGETALLVESAVLLGEVINVNPQFAPAYAELARYYSYMGHESSFKTNPKALALQEQALKRALEIEPRYGYVSAMMGNLKTDARQYDEAAQYFDAAEKSDPHFPLLKAWKANLLMYQKQPQAAIELATTGFKEYENVPEVADKHISVIIHAAKIIKDNDLVDLWYRKRLEISPDVAWNYGDYSGFLLYTMRDTDAAIENAEKALQIMDYGMARRFLATGLYMKWVELDEVPGRKDEALHYFNRARAVNADTDEVLKSLSKKIEFMNVYVKVLNYKIKSNNARQDLDMGIIDKAEYELKISQP